MRRNPQPDDLLSIANAAALLGIGVRTLRLYTNQGKLPDRRGAGGRRRVFLRSDVERFRAQRGCGLGQVVLYAWVSSRRQSQEGDLERQMTRLRSSVAGRKVAGEFSDVASGLNDHRPGLREALKLCATPEVSELVVTHRDRLARFGSQTMEVLLNAMGTSLTVTEVDEQISSDAGPESELVRDMVAIVTSFSGRIHGARSAKARALSHELLMAARHG